MSYIEELKATDEPWLKTACAEVDRLRDAQLKLMLINGRLARELDIDKEARADAARLQLLSDNLEAFFRSKFHIMAKFDGIRAALDAFRDAEQRCRAG